jgi:membrane-bound inhibitor of C-type lysozyme
MIRQAMMVACGLLLAACATSKAPEDAAPAPGGIVVRYACENGETLKVVFVGEGESARVTTSDGHTVSLPGQGEAFGFTFASRSRMLFGKGDEVRWQVVGQDAVTCKAAPKA